MVARSLEETWLVCALMRGGSASTCGGTNGEGVFGAAGDGSRPRWGGRCGVGSRVEEP